MCQRVPPQVAVSTKHLAARGALVRLVIRVGEKVGLEVAALVEASRAHRAFVGRLLHVEDLVHGQCTALAETLAALAALERLLLAVNIPATTSIGQFRRVGQLNRPKGYKGIRDNKIYL